MSIINLKTNVVNSYEEIIDEDDLDDFMDCMPTDKPDCRDIYSGYIRTIDPFIGKYAYRYYSNPFKMYLPITSLVPVHDEHLFGETALYVKIFLRETPDTRVSDFIMPMLESGEI